jgi:hypothetical protein
MEPDDLEDFMPCEFCGVIIRFYDEDKVFCSNCAAEYRNMDYVPDLESDDEIESFWNLIWSISLFHL